MNGHDLTLGGFAISWKINDPTGASPTPTEYELHVGRRTTNTTGVYQVSVFVPIPLDDAYRIAPDDNDSTRGIVIGRGTWGYTDAMKAADRSWRVDWIDDGQASLDIVTGAFRAETEGGIVPDIWMMRESRWLLKTPHDATLHPGGGIVRVWVPKKKAG